MSHFMNLSTMSTLSTEFWSRGHVSMNSYTHVHVTKILY